MFPAQIIDIWNIPFSPDYLTHWKGFLFFFLIKIHLIIRSALYMHSFWLVHGTRSKSLNTIYTFTTNFSTHLFRLFKLGWVLLLILLTLLSCSIIALWNVLSTKLGTGAVNTVYWITPRARLFLPGGYHSPPHQSQNFCSSIPTCAKTRLPLYIISISTSEKRH